MNTVKHYVNKTEVATIVEVLRDLNAANRLKYSNENYTGTAIYQAIARDYPMKKALAIVGPLGYHPRSELIAIAEAYIERNSISPAERRAQREAELLQRKMEREAERKAVREAKDNVRKALANADASKAIFIDQLIKQALASTK